MIIRRFFAVFMLAVLAVGTVNTADAQLFKKHKKKHKQETTTDTETHESRKERKRHRKEERKREKEEKRKHKNKKEKTGNKKDKKTGHNYSTPARRHNVNYPASVHKTRYRVDLLTPLYLDELVHDNKPAHNEIPEKAAAGIAFYQGVKLAADSLTAAGIQIDVYVHDITAADKTPEMLIANKGLDSSDIVIGVVQSREVSGLAALAKKRKVNFVSALSPATGNVKDNPYFTLLQPSLKTHCEWISSDITKKFPNQKIAMLYRTSVQADENARNYFTDEIEGENELKELRCNTLPTKEEMKSVFDTTKPNVVIIPVLDADYADTLLDALSNYFPGTHFEVYGMPTWTGLTGLKKANAYRNLTINISHPFHFDHSDPLVQKIEGNFKKQFNGPPSDWVLRGYETLMWYSGLLSKYGTIFNDKYIDVSDAPLTKFSVIPMWDKRGYILYHENTHLYLTTYEAGMSRTTE